MTLLPGGNTEKIDFFFLIFAFERTKNIYLYIYNHEWNPSVGVLDLSCILGKFFCFNNLHLLVINAAYYFTFMIVIVSLLCLTKFRRAVVLSYRLTLYLLDAMS